MKRWLVILLLAVGGWPAAAQQWADPLGPLPVFPEAPAPQPSRQPKHPKARWGLAYNGLLVINRTDQARLLPATEVASGHAVYRQGTWMGEVLLTRTLNNWRWSVGYAGGYGVGLRVQEYSTVGLSGSAYLLTHQLPLRLARRWLPHRHLPLALVPWVGLRGIWIPTQQLDSLGITTRSPWYSNYDAPSLVGRADARNRLALGYDLGLDLLWETRRWAVGLTARYTDAFGRPQAATLRYTFTYRGVPQPILFGESRLRALVVGVTIHQYPNWGRTLRNGHNEGGQR